MDEKRVLLALAGLVDFLGRLEVGQASLQTAQESLRVDLLARIDRLESALADIRYDISGNLGAVEGFRRVQDNTRVEVRLLGEQLANVLKKVQRLETRVREITGEP